MNWLDLLIMSVLGFFAIWGYRNGMVYGISVLLGSIVGTYIGVSFSESFAQHLKNSYSNNYYFLISIAFFLIFVITYVGFWFLGKFITQALKIVQLSQVNRILGSLLYMLSLVFLLGSLFLLIGTNKSNKSGTNTYTSILPLETRQNSKLFYIVSQSSRTILPYIETSTDEIYKIINKKWFLLKKNSCCYSNS